LLRIQAPRNTVELNIGSRDLAEEVDGEEIETF
jgi:hypothetical protein